MNRVYLIKFIPLVWSIIASLPNLAQTTINDDQSQVDENKINRFLQAHDQVDYDSIYFSLLLDRIPENAYNINMFRLTDTSIEMTSTINGMLETELGYTLKPCSKILLNGGNVMYFSLQIKNSYSDIKETDSVLVAWIYDDEGNRILGKFDIIPLREAGVATSLVVEKDTIRYHIISDQKGKMKIENDAPNPVLWIIGSFNSMDFQSPIIVSRRIIQAIISNDGLKIIGR